MTRTPLVLVLGLAGLVVVLFTAALSLGEREGAVVSYGAASPGAAVIELLAVVGLFVVATLLATNERSRRVAISAFALGLAWAAAPWAGWADAPTAIRSLAVLLVPTVPALALLAVAALVDHPRSRLAAVVLACAALAIDAMLWLVRDPFLDRYCWRDCLAETRAPFVDVDRARTLTNVSLALGIACGLTIALLAVVALRARRSIRRSGAPALGTAVVLGGSLAASSLALLLAPAEDPERTLQASLFAARGLALLLFAAGLGVVALRPRAVRRAITRLAEEPGQATGGDLGSALADALDDPSLRVAYPLADGRLVDAEGASVSLGAAPVRVLRGNDVVALVGSTAGGDVPAASVDRALGPSARLALGNERLRAEHLARLQELTELRRRIVATGDAERRRLEHDLHDGAQQRLLALSFDLRVALSRAESAGRVDVAAELRVALADVGDATAELRTVAHGISPAVLTTSGVVAALESLADTASLVLRFEIAEGSRYPVEVETTVYAIVVEAVTGVNAPAWVTLRDRDGDLVVTVDDAPWSRGVVAIEDRVGAVGGTITSTGRRLEVLLPLSSPSFAASPQAARVHTVL